ncbi:MFS transporter [Halomonadaceae bacterium KBTZ08]
MKLFLAVATVTVMGLFQSSLLATLPWIIDRTGLPAAFWSVLVAASLILVAVSSPVWGRRTDSHGPLPVMRLTMGLVVVSYGLLIAAVLALSAPIWIAAIAIVTRLVYGVATGGVFPSAQRFALADKPVSQWPETLAYIQASTHAGRVLGPGIVALAAIWSLPLGLVLIVVLGVVLWFMQWYFAAGVAAEPGGNREQAQPPPWSEDWPLYGLGFMITLWVGQLQFALGPYLQNLVGVDSVTASQWTGTALMAASVSAIVAGPLGNRWLSPTPRLLCGVWLGVFTLGGVLLAAASGVFGVGAAVCLITAGLTLAAPWYGSILRARRPDAQGQVSGRMISVHTIGFGSGTLVGGLMLELAPNHAMAAFYLLGPLAAVLVVIHHLRVQAGIVPPTA